MEYSTIFTDKMIESLKKANMYDDWKDTIEEDKRLSKEIDEEMRKLSEKISNL